MEQIKSGTSLAEYKFGRALGSFIPFDILIGGMLRMKIRDDFNEYGTSITVFICEYCGQAFSCCPAIPDERLDDWKGCLAVTCESYDPERDVDKMFDNPSFKIVADYEDN